MNGEKTRIVRMPSPIAVLALVLAVLLASFAVSAGSTGADGPPEGATPGDAEQTGAGPEEVLLAAPGPGYRGPFGFGRDATSEEIAAWDIDVRADGAGLPPGSGSPEQGAAIFAQKCSPCHGPTGTEGPFDVLVQPFDPDGSWPQFPRTIGNYWPYASTVYDYVNRAMPFNAPNSLEDDEVYALTAFLLNQNGIIPGDAVMSAETLPGVQMPAQRFFRPQAVPSYRPQ